MIQKDKLTDSESGFVDVSRYISHLLPLQRCRCCQQRLHTFFFFFFFLKCVLCVHSLRFYIYVRVPFPKDMSGNEIHRQTEDSLNKILLH